MAQLGEPGPGVKAGQFGEDLSADVARRGVIATKQGHEASESGEIGLLHRRLRRGVEFRRLKGGGLERINGQADRRRDGAQDINHAAARNGALQPTVEAADVKSSARPEDSLDIGP